MPITQTHGGCVRRSSATRYSRRRGGLAGPLPRRPRRLLEQQPTEPARGQPQPQHAGQPKQQSRLPGCQDTPPPEPASSRRRRVCKGVSRTGHDEQLSRREAGAASVLAGNGDGRRCSRSRLLGLLILDALRAVAKAGEPDLTPFYEALLAHRQIRPWSGSWDPGS